MSSTIQYFLYDLRLTWREPSTRTFLLMPFVFLGLLIWGVPPFLAAFPLVQSWSALLLDGIVLQGGIMFGMVSGMLLLDEKDQGLITVYRVAPITFGKWIALKMAFPLVATFAYALTCFAINPVQHFGVFALLLSALHFALITPLIALIVAALAQNKVEGLTWFKFVDLVMIAPFLGFFLPDPWAKIFLVFPTHWAFDAIFAVHAGEHTIMLRDHLIGIPIICLLLYLATMVFKRSVH